MAADLWAMKAYHCRRKSGEEYLFMISEEEIL
jgi:hypothetical protein